ncbi:unnamed protein product [Porites lobata]|uniref:DNA-PKcs N-terminal domain-containing protein n=1 Tax=Porites lobata TaxID=104759 RepID=A0ABN8P3E1_9CNID|nr:unnamed protein product [Porites lobata]
MAKLVSFTEDFECITVFSLLLGNGKHFPFLHFRRTEVIPLDYTGYRNFHRHNSAVVLCLSESLTGVYLSQLHSLLSANSLQRGVDAVNTAVDLGSFCLQNVSEREQAYSSSLLFHEETGVISFLRKTVALDEFIDAKVELLKFLKTFVNKLEKKVNPYALNIKDVCVKLFSQDRSNKVKVETFPLLAQV